MNTQNTSSTTDGPAGSLALDPRSAPFFTPDGMARLRAAGSVNYKKGLAKRTIDERRKWGRDAGLKCAEKATPEFFERRGKRVAEAVEKEWTLRAPNGVHYSFTNLREFVRTHAHLFSEDELKVLRDGKTRAINGLHGLRPSDTRKRVHGSWHGWTWRLPTDGRRIESVYASPNASGEPCPPPANQSPKNHE